MRVLALLFAVAACGQLPDIDGDLSPEARAAPPAVLAPLDDLLVLAGQPSRAAPAQAELIGRGGRLRGLTLPRPAAGDLSARARRLRERAAALRAAPL